MSPSIPPTGARHFPTAFRPARWELPSIATVVAIATAISLSTPAAGQMTDDDVTSFLDARFLDARQERLADVAMQKWDLAEVGYREEERSALLAGELEVHGFDFTRGAADIPTAFVPDTIPDASHPQHALTSAVGSAAGVEAGYALARVTDCGVWGASGAVTSGFVGSMVGRFALTSTTVQRLSLGPALAASAVGAPGRLVIA